MKRYPIVFLTFFFLVSSVGKGAEKTPLVFVHGFKGAHLADDKGRRRWLTAFQALGLSVPPLGLPTMWRDDVQPIDDLLPGEILRSITVIPYLLEFPIYGRWLAAARASGRPFYPFSYDWRREPEEAVVALEHLIEGIVGKDRGKVLIVGHSMGGLIAFSLMNRRPELFSGGVFAGVPFEGGIGFLPDLHQGTKNGLNRRILTPEVIQSFPSVYTLFPDETEALRDGNEKKKEGLRQVETWKRLEIGPFAKGRAPGSFFERFAVDAFRKAQLFRQGLVPKQKSYPPLLAVIATHRPTLAAARRNGPKAVLGWDFESEPKEPGDGRVRASTMKPPGGLPCETIVSPRDHAELLDDVAVQARIFAMP